MYHAWLHLPIGIPKKFRFRRKFRRFLSEHCSDRKIEWSVCLSAFPVRFRLCTNVPSHVYVCINYTRMVEQLCNKNIIQYYESEDIFILLSVCLWHLLYSLFMAYIAVIMFTSPPQYWHISEILVKYSDFSDFRKWFRKITSENFSFGNIGNLCFPIGIPKKFRFRRNFRPKFSEIFFGRCNQGTMNIVVTGG